MIENSFVSNSLLPALSCLPPPASPHPWERINTSTMPPPITCALNQTQVGVCLKPLVKGNGPWYWTFVVLFLLLVLGSLAIVVVEFRDSASSASVLPGSGATSAVLAEIKEARLEQGVILLEFKDSTREREFRDHVSIKGRLFTKVVMVGIGESSLLAGAVTVAALL